MGILEKFLVKKQGNKEVKLTVNDKISEHQTVLHKCWKELFPDVKSYATQRKDAEDAADKVLKKYELWDEKIFENKWSECSCQKPAASGAAIRDEWIKAADQCIQTAFDVLYPPPKVSRKSYKDLENAQSIRLLQGSLKAKIDANYETKIASIYDMGSNYRGHGATTNPFSEQGIANVMHAHVGNGSGVAFKWNNGVLEICGVGKKDGNTTKGTSGYTWDWK